jgi:hypothetical protein
MIHYFTLYTPSQQRLNIAASAPPSRHCHYLAPPLPSLVVLVAPLPPHSTGRSVHLEGIMLSTSVERAPGKHVKSPGGAAWASKRNNQTAKSSGGGRGSGSGGGCGSGSGSAAVAAAATQWQWKRQRSGGGGSCGGGSGSGSGSAARRRQWQRSRQDSGSGSGSAAAAAAAAQQRLRQQRSGSGCQNGLSSRLLKLLRYYLVSRN